MNEERYSALAAGLAAALPGFLPRQRWYGDKGQSIARVELADAALLAEDAGSALLLAIASVRFTSTRRASYLLPLRLGADGAVELETALQDAAWQRACLDASRENRRFAGRRGEFVFSASARHGRWLAELTSGFRGRLSRAEQSNSSVIFARAEGADLLLLKCFRRLAAGLNPDYEVTQFLGERTDFTSLPLLAGGIAYRPQGEGEPWTLALWQQYIANHGDGWSYMVEALADGHESEALLAELGGLGQRTAELHAALASGTEPSFAPEPIAAADLQQWVADLAQWIGHMAPELKRAADAMPAGGGATARQALARMASLPDMAAALAPLAGLAKIRIHGDYHLGQVLRTQAGDWAIFDFEGEPARPLAERRRKHSVLRDVAGMLRSLDYLAFAAGEARAVAGQAPLAAAWRGEARQAFWHGYREALGATAHSAALLPATGEEAERALGFFEIEKAVYEIAYELHHRPDWLPIPLAGLERLLIAKQQQQRL
ncbi:MAG: maltokinase N-terminal cap-like domain-containing protein [Terriglobales bacterium]